MYDELSTIVAEKAATLMQSASEIDGLGLYRGKTGALLALHAARRALPNACSASLEKTIVRLQDEIAENAAPTDSSFNNGLFGIAWGIGMLYERRYLIENRDSVMDSLDDELYKLVLMQKLTNPDIETGIMGRMMYYLHRVTDALKARSKYRYLLNYELLMSLMDALAPEIEKIIEEQRQGNAQAMDRLLQFGGLYSGIFILLTIQIKKRIHQEVAERQQIKFIRIFLNFFKFLTEHPRAAFQNAGTYQNTIPILNCLLWASYGSRFIHHQLDCGTPLLNQFVHESFSASPKAQHFPAKLFFLHLHRDAIAHEQLKKQVISHDWKYNNWGMSGFSGTLYTLSLFLASRTRSEDLDFLLFSTGANMPEYA